MDERLVGTTRPARYGAATIDNILAFVCLFACANLLGQNAGQQTDRWQIAIGLIVFAVYLLYFFLFEWLIDATPGKLFAGLTVRKLDGTKCGVRTAFLRTATRLIEVNPLFLGCLPAAIIIRYSARHQRWGDRIARCVVIERNMIT